MSDLYAESELLIAVASGNEDAFRQLFFRYHQELGTHVFRVANSIELAEEIVQDVFLKIWMNRDDLTDIKNFKAYLFVISKNHTLNCLRKLARERMYKLDWDDRFENIPSLEANTNIYHNLLDEAINQLPPQQQKVYLLSRHGRLKYAEVATELDISRETVKKYLQIATASITAYVQTNFGTTVLLSVILSLW